MGDRLIAISGVRGWHLQAGSFGSIGLCIALWIRAKTIGEDERGNAERRALFVGLWPPMFWLIGETIDRRRAATRSTKRGAVLTRAAKSARGLAP